MQSAVGTNGPRMRRIEGNPRQIFWKMYRMSWFLCTTQLNKGGEIKWKHIALIQVIKVFLK